MRVAGVSTLQAVACFFVAAAGLVPVVQENRPFWGLYCISFDNGAPRVHQVDSDSAASAAGLRSDDVILSVNGSAADFTGLMAVMDRLQPGETATLRVKRGEAELDVTAAGVEPPIAAIYYPTVWHPIAGLVGLALGLMVVATQPLRPAPRWRASVLGVGGLAMAVVFFLAIAQDNVFAYWQVRRYHNVNWGVKWHFEQNWTGLTASLVLAFLGAWELRRRLGRSAAAEVGPPDEPVHQGGPA